MSEFDLNEYIASVALDTINLISLTYYSSKSEIMNIYDTNFEFDENIVPLVTSVLEINPTIVNAKRYCNVNSESIIMISSNEIPNKSQISFPCFFSDIQQNKLNMKNIQGYTRKLISTLDNVTDKELDSDGKLNSSLLVRMYKLENKKGEYGHCILNEEELTIIVWSWEYANFQIIINKNKPKICQLHINIYITEDNKIIMSKLEHINNIIAKIDKIKNEMVSRAM